MSFPLYPYKRTYVHRDVQECLSRHSHSHMNASTPAIAVIIAVQRTANVNDRTVLLYSRSEQKLVDFGGIWQENASGTLTLRSPACYAAKTYQYDFIKIACNCIIDPTIPHEAAIPRAEKCADTGLYALVCHKKPNMRADGTLDYSNTCGLNVPVFNFNDTAPRTVPSAAQLPAGAIVIPAKPAKALTKATSSRRATPASSDIDIDVSLFFDDDEDVLPASDPPVASDSKRNAASPAAGDDSLLRLHVPTSALKRRKSTGDNASNMAPIDVPPALVPVPESKMRRLASHAQELIRMLFTPDAGLDVDAAKELNALISDGEECSICRLRLARSAFKDHILQPSHIVGNK